MMRQIEFRRDGYLVAKRLRELSETRASCLIALTGYGQPADRERARDAGFDHLLTKPADPDVLRARSTPGSSPPPRRERPGKWKRSPMATESSSHRPCQAPIALL